MSIDAALRRIAVVRRLPHGKWWPEAEVRHAAWSRLAARGDSQGTS